MYWLYLLLVLGCFVFVLKILSVGLMILCLLVVFVFLLVWVCGCYVVCFGDLQCDLVILIDVEELCCLCEQVQVCCNDDVNDNDLFFFFKQFCFMIQFSVNVNKIVVLCNLCGGVELDVVCVVQVCLDVGVYGIIVYSWLDCCYIIVEDVLVLFILICVCGVEFNIEGNFFVLLCEGYLGLLLLCEQICLVQVILVFDGDGQIIFDYGFDFEWDVGCLCLLVVVLKVMGCWVSLFVDVGNLLLEQVVEVGVDCIELYIGFYVEVYVVGDVVVMLELFVIVVWWVQVVGLGVNVGYDLLQDNLCDFLGYVLDVLEVLIGYVLIGEVLYDGLDVIVWGYLVLL